MDLCSQEGELDVEEGRDLLQESSSVATNAAPPDKGEEEEKTPPSKGPRLPTLKLANPFTKKKVGSDFSRNYSVSKVTPSVAFSILHSSVSSALKSS
jgi:hypothetical protein